ncbi:MAG: DUF1704 domain-containing protein [Candidatus Omnitrophica bacterium]|nr:DUF1704 domain-containing protein [Candidatus Omnitrophota bacterium]
MDLIHIDKKISEIGSRIDFYSQITPVNRIQEEKRFFDELSRGERYDPVFTYRRTDVSRERREIELLVGSISSNDPLSRMLKKKALFLLSHMELLEADEDSLGGCAVSLFGKPDEGCLSESRGILDPPAADGSEFPEETVAPGEMAEILSVYIRERGIPWEVRLTDNIVPKLTVSGARGVIYINSRLNYTPHEVERLKVHEVLVHVYRGLNGKKQPYRIFAEGTAGYNETEEGLAVMAEKITGVLETDRRQMRLYAGRAVCAGLCLEMSFSEAFDALRADFPDGIAYRLVERAKRGMKHTRKKGCLTKGFHYISGYRKMREYVSSGRSPAVLFAGKISIDDSVAVEELLRKKQLRYPDCPPELWPGGLCEKRMPDGP